MVDAVYTWVDGSDPPFRESFLRRLSESPQPDAAAARRFRDNGELRYSLRSLAAFAPWVRRVHIVTNGQVPAWLAPQGDRLRIVTHEMLFPDPARLPTFNSHAIELLLHRIPGLSRRFLYFNDDCFLGRPLEMSDFITAKGGIRAYFEPTPLPPESSGRAVHDRAYMHTREVAARLLGGRRLSLLPAHMPQLYDRDVLARLAELFRFGYEETLGHPLRSENDLVLRILYFSWMLYSGEQLNAGNEEAVLQWGAGSYSFLMLSARLHRMLSAFIALRLRRPKFFCVNDDLRGSPLDSAVLTSFRLFLRSYFPRRSPFEKG